MNVTKHVSQPLFKFACLIWILSASVWGGAAPALADPVPASPRWTAELEVKELTAPSGFHLRVTYAPDIAPQFSGHLFLVHADSAFGESAYLIPVDIALEYGNAVYQVAQHHASDLFGSVLGGRLREGERQMGFFFAPQAFPVEEFLATQADTLRLRYANRRADFVPSGGEEKELLEVTLMASINAWWDWSQSVAALEPVKDNEAWMMADRIMPGQAELVLNSRVSPTSLRNTILRVGDRKLVRSPATQRVAPRFPTAARQAGVGGLVVLLAYTSGTGAVEDVTLLASDTAHMLNFCAMEAVSQWRFMPARDESGANVDGWRVVPVQFQVGDNRPAPVPPPATVEREVALLRKVESEYPDRAYHNRIEGTVIYEAVINPQGKMVQATLVQSVDPVVDEAALVALEKCLFEPALSGGKPVEGAIRVSFQFPPPVSPN